MSKPISTGGADGDCWEVRRLLLQIVACHDPRRANENKGAGLRELLSLAKSFEGGPESARAVMKRVGRLPSDTEPDGELAQELQQVCAAWLTELQARNPACSAVEIFPPIQTNPPLPPPEPILPWEQSVGAARAGLLNVRKTGVWAGWFMPDLLWRTAWEEAYLVVGGEGTEGQAVGIIPSARAANSVEAKGWWQRKIQAAQRLRQQSRTDPRWARVLDHARVEDPTHVLLECLHVPRPLTEWSARPMNSSAREDIEMVCGLCELLGSLNEAGSCLMDLPLAGLSARWSVGLRTMHLADPTAVIPNTTLLPPYRRLSRLPAASAAPAIGPVQVYLVGAVLMARLRRDFSCWDSGIGVSGRMAGLAALAGWPELADRPAAQLVEPLTSEFQQQRRMQGVKVPQLVETLRWALSERAEERYPTVWKLMEQLGSCLPVP